MLPEDSGNSLRTTGGQIDDIVLNLIESVCDKNEIVTSTICKSLCSIGKHHPNLVLSSCHSYLRCHPKLALAHKILILGVVEQICSEALKSIKKSVALEIIALALEEMVSSKEIVPEWQNVASGILASLGRNFLHDVMDKLLANFHPGVLPHFFILQTMANLASTNVFGMVPFLKLVLGTLLPLLCTVKQENMRWIFAHALSRFSEAITEYIINVEKAPDPTVNKSVFVSEISSAYDVLFNNWMQSREPKVRSEVVVALGNMSYILNLEKLEDLLPKLIPAVLALYKRNQDHQFISQGLCMILDASISNKSSVIDDYLDNIFNALYYQVCTCPDYSMPATVRNHNEVLRCFTVLASTYSDRLLMYLLLKLENSNETQRIASLTVIKHLINSSGLQSFLSLDVVLKDKIHQIISVLKLVLDTSNNMIRKVITQVIVALAHRGYLSNEEGGPELVRFIINMCALHDDTVEVKKPVDPYHVSNESLRIMCNNVLYLLATNVEKMHPILWPYLFDFLLSDPLTPAVGIICKTLAFLAEKEKEESGADFTIEFSSLSYVTTPHCLLARLIVFIGRPFEHGNRGVHILQLLKSVSSTIGRNLKALWDTKIPHMTQMLDQNINGDFPNWNHQLWQGTISDFFIQTLAEYDREEWAIKLGKTFLQQLPLYATLPKDKFVLFKFLGIIMKKVSNKTFVGQALDAVFDNVNHHNALDREGCAIVTGLCAASHLDLVLVKLEQIAKDDKKSISGLFGFIKEFKGDVDYERLKATVILCYGHVTANGSPDILYTRIETPILRSVSNFFMSSSKDTLVRECMLMTVKLIADAVHPNKMNKFMFRSRNELINLMKTILKEEGLNASVTSTSIRSLALNAAASLVATDPVLKDDEKCSLIEVAVSSVCALPKEIPKELTVKRNTDDDAQNTINFDMALFSAMDALNVLLEKLLIKERNYGNLETIIQILSIWLNSKHDVERERCINSVLHLLNVYSKSIENDVYTPFSTFGNILGILLPRCTDPQITVRHLAFDSIETLLHISLRLQVHNRSQEDVTEFSISNLKEQIITDATDAETLFVVTKNLGKVICDKLPTDQVSPFIKSLMNGLCDPHFQSVSGTSVVLTTVMKRRGGEIRQDVLSIMELMREKFPSIEYPTGKTGAQGVIKNMAVFHSQIVLSVLMDAQLPMDEYTSDIWKSLVTDENLAKLVTEHCLEILRDKILVTPPDPHGRSNSQIAVLKPLVAVCVLDVIFKVPQMEKCCRDNFSQIFSILLLTIGQYVGAIFSGNIDYSKNVPTLISKKMDPKAAVITPVRCAISAMENFFRCSYEMDVASTMSDRNIWFLLQDPKAYSDAVAVLAKSLCLHCSDYIPKIIAHLNPMLNSSVAIHRVATVAVFAQFLNQPFIGRAMLAEPLVNNLLGRLVDESRLVRKLCIRGLGCIAKLEKEQVQRYLTTIFSAMMTGLDDRDDPECDITLEAMNGLSFVLSKVTEVDVRGMLINITLKVKPMLEKEKPVVRASAFTLFGNLSQFCEGPSMEPFLEQVHNNLISLLLHLNDVDDEVVKVCKRTLKFIGPLLNCDEVNLMFQKHLLDDGHLHYGEFVNGVTKNLIKSFPTKISFYATTCLCYLKSSHVKIQCNATIFLGHLLGNLSVDQQYLVSKERICSALISLLKDQSSDVRFRAAEALSLLYEY